MNGIRIAVIGATGAVGRVFLRILEERRFPATTIRLCASERSWGKKLTVNGSVLTVEEATSQLLDDVDMVFISAGSEVSRELAPLAAERGALVIDKSSAFRMDPDVPLVIPEVNADDLESHHGTIASPNCSTTPLAMALSSLMELSAVQRVVAATYQSVSGTGAAAMDELRRQSRDVLDGRGVEPSAYPHQIAFNVLPHIEPFAANGYTDEEMKMVNETRKILHAPELPVSATCVRVPVLVGHSEAVHVEFADAVSADDVRSVLSEAPGVRVLDQPGNSVYPMPIDAEGRDEVFVGRIRQDVSQPRGVAMWLACDNLRKGAALNAIQIAEELLRRDLVAPDRRASRLADSGVAYQADQERTTEEREFEEAQAFYEANFEAILAEYEGRYVAILRGKVVDSDFDFSELAERVYGGFGDRGFFIPRVQKTPRIVDLGGPRVVERYPIS